MGERVNHVYGKLDQIEKNIHDLQTQNATQSEASRAELGTVRERMVTTTELSDFLQKLDSCITGQLPTLPIESKPIATPLEIAAPQIVPELPKMEELPLQETVQISRKVGNIVQEAKHDIQERAPQEKPKEEPKKRRFRFFR